jgi:hypothetical protein
MKQSFAHQKTLTPGDLVTCRTCCAIDHTEKKEIGLEEGTPGIYITNEWDSAVCLFKGRVVHVRYSQLYHL